eukprot:TRINITY_DN39315_c0_g2_i2.p1 TRINITY_DN39315_c0_g2~~TRINITY_DN39315_c0_g2_i2.p1  ORF type:complete len:167 (-),score=47.97 TRINITY_DN39315_c0_g2_i2:71-571(-)
MEVTSKRPVGRFREVVKVPTKRSRDPRFDGVSGRFNQDGFDSSYSFLNDSATVELQKLQAQLKDSDGDDAADISRRITILGSQIQAKETGKLVQKAKSERRKKEQALVKKGKKPFFLKKSAQKEEEMLAKFKNLKKTGKLEKFIQKKRKKNASKEKRFLPRQKASQ